MADFARLAVYGGGLPGRAREELATTLVDLAGCAVALAEDLDDGYARRPGEIALSTRRVRMLSLQALYAARNYELAAGTSWPELAEALGLAESDARALHSGHYYAWAGGSTAHAGLPPHLGMPAGRGTLAGRWARVRTRLRRRGRTAAR